MAYWKPEHLHAAASCATEIQVVFDRNNSWFVLMKGLWQVCKDMGQDVCGWY